MAEETSKKSIFSKAVDAFTSRDEKAALDAAQQQLAQAQAEADKLAKELAAMKASSGQASTQSAAQIEAANKKAAEAEAQVKALQQKMEAMARAQEMEAKRQELNEQMKAQIAAAAPKFMAEHTLTKEETLSHLSLKYYGSATKPYWMVIYEANKAVIGDNPNKVHAGMVVKIPVLPESLKKK